MITEKAPSLDAERPAVGRLRAAKAPAVFDTVVAGGLHVIAVRKPGVPMVHARLVFPVGPDHLLRPAPLLVMGKSILGGTAEHDREGLAMAVERLGGSLSAGESDDLFVIGGSALSERLRELLGLLGEVVAGATYPNREVETDRARQADEVTIALSRPEVLAEEAFGRRLFGRHPYGADVPRPEAIVKVAATGLRRLHPSLVAPGSAHLVLVGDLQPKRAVALVESELAAWLQSGDGSFDASSTALPELPTITSGPLELVDRPGSVQSNLRMGGAAPDRLQPEWPAMALANAIIGGMFTSRLVENLRERNGYTYSPRSAVYHGRAGSTFRFAAEVATSVTAASLVEIRYELGRIATSGVTDEEVEAARRYVTGSFLFQTATQAGLASTLARWAAVGIGPGYLTEYPAKLGRVRQQDIESAARRWLAPAKLVTVVLGDAAETRAALSGVDEVAGG